MDDLYVADVDGANPHRIMAQEIFPAVDTPRFCPDGNTLLFSAVDDEAQSSSRSGFLARTFGLQVASTHAAPSDLWSVPLRGGEPTRLTHLGDVGLSADYAPDGQNIAFVTASLGIFVMNADGTEYVWALSQPGLDSPEWIP